MAPKLDRALPGPCRRAVSGASARHVATALVAVPFILVVLGLLSPYQGQVSPARAPRAMHLAKSRSANSFAPAAWDGGGANVELEEGVWGRESSARAPAEMHAQSAELDDAAGGAPPSAKAAKLSTKAAARGPGQGRGEAAADDVEPGEGSDSPRGRMLAYTGAMDLRVARVGAAKRALLAAIAAFDGYAGRVTYAAPSDGPLDAEGSGSDGQYAEVEAHVPSKRVHAFLDRLRSWSRPGGPGTAQVTREQLVADDVTGSYWDADSRARNLRAARQRVEELMARAKDVHEVLAVQRELTRITGQLEAGESRRKHLAGQAQMARVTVRLWRGDEHSTDPDPEPEPFVQWAITEHAYRAVQGVAQSCADGATFLVVAVIYAAPLCVAGFLLAPVAVCAGRVAGPRAQAVAHRIRRVWAMAPPQREDERAA